MSKAPSTEKVYLTPVRLSDELMDYFDRLRIEVRRRHGRNLLRAGVLREAIEGVFSPEVGLDFASVETPEAMGRMVRECLIAGSKSLARGKKPEAA